MSAMNWELRRFTGADGVELVADLGGDPDAPPVILLHGGGQTRHSWGGAMRELVGRGYHVINLDARGHGDSGWAPDGEYSFAKQAEDLARVVATLRRPPALVGASMGGATSLEFSSAQVPPRAAVLVLVDIVPRLDIEGANRIRAFMRANPDGFATIEEAAAAVQAYNPHRPPPKDHTGLMKNLRHRSDGRLRWHWDPRLVTGHDGVEPPLPVHELMRAAERVRIPTLLVRGLKSDIVSDEGVADLRRRIPHAEVFDVAEAGHMVAGDRNDAFNRGVVEFLDRHLLRPTSSGTPPPAP
jgi:pimeloyl-ACP methyl ester carboxylesterase